MPIVVVPVFAPEPILVFVKPLVLILVVPVIVAPPVPDIEPVPALRPTPVMEPVEFNELTPVIAELLLILTPLRDSAYVLAEVIARAPVEVKLGVVTLVEKVGLLTIPTVRVPPNETVPPVTLPTLFIVIELF